MAFLLSRMTRCSRLTLDISCPRPGISQKFQGTLVSFTGKSFSLNGPQGPAQSAPATSLSPRLPLSSLPILLHQAQSCPRAFAPAAPSAGLPSHRCPHGFLLLFNNASTLTTISASPLKVPISLHLFLSAALTSFSHVSVFSPLAHQPDVGGNICLSFSLPGC